MDVISNQPLCLSAQDHGLTKNWANYYCFIKGRVTWPNSKGKIDVPLSARTIQWVVWACQHTQMTNDKLFHKCLQSVCTFADVTCQYTPFQYGYRKILRSWHCRTMLFLYCFWLYLCVWFISIKLIDCWLIDRRLYTPLMKANEL